MFDPKKLHTQNSLDLKVFDIYKNLYILAEDGIKYKFLSDNKKFVFELDFVECSNLGVITSIKDDLSKKYKSKKFEIFSIPEVYVYDVYEVDFSLPKNKKELKEREFLYKAKATSKKGYHYSSVIGVINHNNDFNDLDNSGCVLDDDLIWFPTEREALSWLSRKIESIKEHDWSYSKDLDYVLSKYIPNSIRFIQSLK